LASEASRGQTP